MGAVADGYRARDLLDGLADPGDVRVHNWDLLAVTASVAGVYLWWSGRPRLAALAFAIGGGFKLYPALFIVPLVCDRLVRRRTREAVEVGAVGGGSLV